MKSMFIAGLLSEIPHCTTPNSKVSCIFSLSHVQVEQPLCLECMRVLSDKLDKEVEDVNRDTKSYEICLQRLEGESKTVLSETEFLMEKLKVRIPQHHIKLIVQLCFWELYELCGAQNFFCLSVFLSSSEMFKLFAVCVHL